MNDITEALLAATRRWHGTFNEQFSAIDNLVKIIEAHQPDWALPPALFAQLRDNRDRLEELNAKCGTLSASAADRYLRKSLLKLTVDLCVLKIKLWAYGQYAIDVMTLEDVHMLGFLLPGKSGGHHSRHEATDVKPGIRVRVINTDFIRVTLSRSDGMNAAQAAHGWPTGVRHALIVILADDGKTEVYHKLTTRLHNDIQMPQGSHGKLFIVKAAFLRHVDDHPRFGTEQTVSMPLTTEDLVPGN
ncbi:MAG: hypothetical protein LBF69_04250 [Prevotellaceae bacterium]|jgi:hypothetical protein|nr:hypothetical protein [Prevotellaceae bacterium]